MRCTPTGSCGNNFFLPDFERGTCSRVAEAAAVAVPTLTLTPHILSDANPIAFVRTQNTMEALLDSAKQIATAHRETQRLAALQTDLDMLENGESIAAALELQEEESRNSAVEALEAAIRRGVELDEAEEQAQESQRKEDAGTALALTQKEELEAVREDHRLRLVAAADEVVAGEMQKQVKREEERVAVLEERSQKLALKVSEYVSTQACPDCEILSYGALLRARRGVRHYLSTVLLTYLLCCYY